MSWEKLDCSPLITVNDEIMESCSGHSMRNGIVVASYESFGEVAMTCNSVISSLSYVLMKIDSNT